jgi:hypothetical protein
MHNFIPHYFSLAAEKRRRKCAPRNVAHLQEHETREARQLV